MGLPSKGSSHQLTCLYWFLLKPPSPEKALLLIVQSLWFTVNLRIYMVGRRSSMGIPQLF